LNVNDDEGLNIFEESVMNAIIQELSQIGEITLVRFVDDTMWVTFRDGQAALSAVQRNELQVCNLLYANFKIISIFLKLIDIISNQLKKLRKPNVRCI